MPGRSGRRIPVMTGAGQEQMSRCQRFLKVGGRPPLLVRICILVVFYRVGGEPDVMFHVLRVLKIWRRVVTS